MGVLRARVGGVWVDIIGQGPQGPPGPPGSGGSTTPGGSNTQVQFNDSGAFGGDSGLTYDKATDTLTAGGVVAANAFFNSLGTTPLDGSKLVNDSVPYSKLSNVAASKLLGRGSASGSGDPEEITLGTNLSISGTTINAAGGAPGGATTQVQFNDAGAFNGDSKLTFNKTTGVLSTTAAALGTNPAQAGSLRLPNNDWIRFRGAANISDIRCIIVGSDDNIYIGNDSTNVQLGAACVLTVPSGQIAFPGTQNPSGLTNVLDDYKEGTWTPALTGVSGGSGNTYTNQTGTYLKIGKVVIIQGHIQLSVLGTLTGNVIISGLPYAIAATNYQAINIGIWQNLAVATTCVGGYFEPGTSRVQLYRQGASSTTGMVNIIPSDLVTGFNLLFSGSYFTTN